MPRGTRHRLSGILLASQRGPELHLDDGGIFALDLDHGRELIGERVTVEGIRSGFDSIDVTRIEREKLHRDGERR